MQPPQKALQFKCIPLLSSAAPIFLLMVLFLPLLHFVCLHYILPTAFISGLISSRFCFRLHCLKLSETQLSCCLIKSKNKAPRNFSLFLIWQKKQMFHDDMCFLGKKKDEMFWLESRSSVKDACLLLNVWQLPEGLFLFFRLAHFFHI